MLYKVLGVRTSQDQQAKLLNPFGILLIGIIFSTIFLIGYKPES